MIVIECINLFLVTKRCHKLILSHNGFNKSDKLSVEVD